MVLYSDYYLLLFSQVINVLMGLSQTLHIVPKAVYLTISISSQLFSMVSYTVLSLS